MCVCILAYGLTVHNIKACRLDSNVASLHTALCLQLDGVSKSGALNVGDQPSNDSGLMGELWQAPAATLFAIRKMRRSLVITDVHWMAGADDDPGAMCTSGPDCLHLCYAQ